VWVEDAYEWREAAIYWNSGPYEGSESVRIGDAHTKHLKSNHSQIFCPKDKRNSCTDTKRRTL